MLAELAPDRYRVEVRRDGLPEEARDLDTGQREFLAALGRRGEQEAPSAGDEWQDLIFRVASDAGIPSSRAFAAVYLAFLGRPNGPRAGWLLASLERAFVLERLRDGAFEAAPT